MGFLEFIDHAVRNREYKNPAIPGINVVLSPLGVGKVREERKKEWQVVIRITMT